MFQILSRSLVIILCFLYIGQTIAQSNNTVTFVIDVKRKQQVIDNIGASGCWYSEGIGKYWPKEKREQIAEWLFSKELDANGNPKGIGLSAWRFNIGGGTFEQGEKSGIKDVNRRVECFQNADGSYDWSKQSGYVWFVKKAKEYGVENLIAFSNTPPVHFTKNGLGFKIDKDFVTNLKPENNSAYAGFLADVLTHFEKEGLGFKYISPVNEPQWDWSNKPGEASQEGSPWKNNEIYDVVTALDSALSAQNLTTKIMVTEAATLEFLYKQQGAASSQIQQFFSDTSKLSIRNLKHLPKFIAGHSYFTDAGDSNRVAVRRKLKETAASNNVDFWQTEYSLLGDGYKDGKTGRRSAMDCALFLAKVIHTDLTVANAAAWHFWNSYEPGNPDFDTRYYLVALEPNDTYTDGAFYQTKNLWAMGNFSRFIRPGMQRLEVSRTDNKDDVAASQDLMLSAYINSSNQLVMVAINYTNATKEIDIKLPNYGKIKSIEKFVTSEAEGHNLKWFPVKTRKPKFQVPPRSITTYLIN